MKTDYSRNYVAELEKKFATERAREHAYRPALNSFFEAISGLNVVNDPKRSEHGAPDFVFLKGKTIVTAYAEAKDITVSLNETAKSEQLERYYGYSSLILTNYLEFRFYRNGQPYGHPIAIAEIKGNEVVPIEINFSSLEDTLKDFLEQAREPITSGAILSKVMAGKARRIRDNIKNFLKSSDEKKNESLLSVYNAIKKLLLAELDYEKFADMYAQTLVYGLFVARFYDKTQDTFTRQEARDLVPASNPFLRQFFDHIAGASFDGRLEFIVNELCEEFTHADVRAIVHNYFKTDKDRSRDPIIHFYEDFLKEYSPKERLSLGVFYTPLPVVNFIVRAIDEILRTDFKLLGLADNSKVEVVRLLQGTKIRKKIHKVQLLDPATGTGTFLNETILHVKKSFAGQEGRWPKYVKEELLPRLHGFELMMAPYTIAHLKISSTLKETGAEIGEDRIGIYLTNSLEKIENKQRDLFSFGLAHAITKESQLAAEVKNELPIMVVLGNPPYSGESMNPEYTDNDVYKFEPGTNTKLQERNSKWINDDYVKFLRLAENLIEKTGEGIVGMITAHGYLDNPTFRGMRYHLMQTFDSLYFFDLHGNANKKETAPNGDLDKNVFDIKQGVAIILAIKNKRKSKKFAEIFRFDLQGSREKKFAFLSTAAFSKVPWGKVEAVAPKYEFVLRNSEMQKEYLNGFSINDLFSISSVGIVTSRDDFIIDMDRVILAKRIQEFLRCATPQEALSKFNLRENRKWRVATALKHEFDENNITPFSYRPFDNRFIYYSEDFIERSRREVMQHMLNGDNTALEICRQAIGGRWEHVFIAKGIVDDSYVSNRTRERGYVLPLYLYLDNGSRVVNFKKEILVDIEKIIGKTPPEDVLDYIYAVLHSPNYREKYNEFLKIDFPRVPYPKSEKQYFELAKLGEELRKLHLLNHPILSHPITTYSQSGNDEVEKVEYKDAKVYINKTQYFGGISQEVWEFYIGGYQPAQKWLKDRKSRTLSEEEIAHYQKIIVALAETGRLMVEIDKVLIRK